MLDYVQWDRPDGLVPGPNAGGLYRATIDQGTGTMTRRRLAEPGSVEFPRIDERRLGRPHTTVALAGESGTQELVGGDNDALRWIDAPTGATTRWCSGDLAVGEPTYVPRPGDLDEQHGWWVAYATDRTDGASSFLVIPASDPASGPVARVHIPTRVPLGLHGAWLPTEE